jgi:AraC-like DNA-binding protein
MPRAQPIDVEIITPPAGVSFRLLRWTDNLRDVEQLAPGGDWLPFEGRGDHWHLHREMELTYVATGGGLRLVGDHLERFEAPELELLGPNLPHCLSGLRGSRGISMQFHWPVDHPVRALPEFSGLAPLWERARRGLVFAAEVVERIGRRMLEAPRLPAAGRLGLLLELLAELASLPEGLSRSLSRLAFAVQEGERYQAGIERVIRHVLEHYAEPLPLGEALQIAGMSKASFERQFPRYAGCTFTEFLNRVRLDHARRQVLGTSKPISEIAYQTGFNHLSHFNRLYRRAFDATPSAERKSAVASRDTPGCLDGSAADTSP